MQTNLKNKVVIVGNDSLQRSRLKRLLSEKLLEVVVSEPIHAASVKNIFQAQPDLVLVDLVNKGENNHALSRLIKEVETPMIFNHVAFSNEADEVDMTVDMGNLIYKIGRVCHGFDVNGDGQKPFAVDGETKIKANYDAKSVEFNSENMSLTGSGSPVLGSVSDVWLVIGTLGAVEDIKKFIACLPEDLEVAIVVMVSIDKGLSPFIVRKFNQLSAFSVALVEPGARLRNKHIILVPEYLGVVYKHNGRFELFEEKTDDQSCHVFDDILTEVSEAYGANTGVIVFSGIGNDGLLGCEKVESCNGTLMVQDVSICKYSSLPQLVLDNTAAMSLRSPEEMISKMREVQEKNKNLAFKRN